jgi:hypothetical protein
MVFNALDTRAPGAGGAAKEGFFRLDSVTDNPASAICANRRKFMNRAFETIENVPVSRRNHFKCQIIIISANITLCHFSRPISFSSEFF